KAVGEPPARPFIRPEDSHTGPVYIRPAVFVLAGNRGQAFGKISGSLIHRPDDHMTRFVYIAPSLTIDPLNPRQPFRKPPREVELRLDCPVTVLIDVAPLIIQAGSRESFGIALAFLKNRAHGGCASLIDVSRSALDVDRCQATRKVLGP